MSLQLPDVVETYFQISNGGDASRLVACFSAEATVIDENKTHQGIVAIQAWQQQTRQAFTFQIEPQEAILSGDKLTVTTRVTGDFSGSPVELDHVFMLKDGRIDSLEIAP